jgi:hypothetical protein
VCLGSGRGVGDDHFAVADGDVLAGERLKLGSEVAGTAMLVDPGFVVSGPKVAECGVGVGQQVVRELTNAMRPRVPASHGLPLARPLLVDLPADGSSSQWCS